jgi:hypothetical protein
MEHRIAFWITKTSNIFNITIFNTYCFSAATKITRTRLIVTLYVISYLVIMIFIEEKRCLRGEICHRCENHITQTHNASNIPMSRITHSSHISYTRDSGDVIIMDYLSDCGPGSVVGIAAGYGLDGLGIECRCGQDFSHLSRPALEAKQSPVQYVPGLSREVKSGRGVKLTPHILLVPLVVKE